MKRNVRTIIAVLRAVIGDGKIIYERGYGLAKLEDGIAITPDKVFDIGSVSG